MNWMLALHLGCAALMGFMSYLDCKAGNKIWATIVAAAGASFVWFVLHNDLHLL